VRRFRRTIAWVSSSLVLMTISPIHAGASRWHTIVAGGDIACPRSPCRHQRETARLVQRIDPEKILALGDLQYEVGSLRAFRRSYDPTWGRFKSRTDPVPGNHEYGTPRAAGFFAYFASGIPNRGGWYAFNLGAWHLVALNSRRGATPSAKQLAWLSQNLQGDHHACELAYFHHPRWSSGTMHGNDLAMSAFWNVLFAHGVDVILNGHEHNYERFARLDPRGVRSRAGIREFVVGTGGIGSYPFGSPQRGSQVRRRAFGVLRMELDPGRYHWRFVSTRRGTLDRGSTACHQ
jgi:acid phosphatase type 7